MKINPRNTILSLFLLSSAACKEKVTQQQLINAALEIKMAQWRESQIKTCDEKILEEAEKYVDSVLVVRSLETKLDTIAKPEKPVKPVKPAFKEKPDSVVVEKIYKKDN